MKIAIAAAIISAIMLSGCTTAPRVITKTVQVTRTEYVPLDQNLLPKIEAPTDPATVTTNGAMFQAWQHDAGQLGKCKPAVDGIRSLQPIDSGQ